ncbi:MAG: hypothetical protein Q8M09_08050 [Pseudomonadota bacterium]|nr:hypothetical protein [Pseudomonadota bacterium]MDP1904180.1 hypothetical protein [Pseudomonadota bacterium]
MRFQVLVQGIEAANFRFMDTLNSDKTWLFDGEPEYVDLNVVATSSVDGGYVMVLELASNNIRLAATRHPAKYITAWRRKARRFGLPDVVRVMVSKPHLRYEAIKRGLARLMSDHKDEASDAYRLGRAEVTQKAREVFEAAGM